MKSLKSKKEFDTELLKILCCPACKSDLIYIKKLNKLKCSKCKKDYLIKEGIPILLVK